MTGQILAGMPAELLSEIAGNLNVHEVLCFTATCHTIRDACLDPLLFKALVEHQHTLYDFYSLNLDRIALRMHQDANVLARYKFFELHADTRQVTDWDKAASADTLQQHFGLDQEVWFRYAVADHRIFQLCNQLNSSISAGMTKLPNFDSLRQSLQFLPHLLMLKHPAIHSTGLAPAFMAQISLACRPQHVNGFEVKAQVVPEIQPRLAFCYCVTMLSQDTPEMSSLDTGDPRAALSRFFIERTREAGHRLRTAVDKRDSDSDSDVFGPMLSQSHTQVLIGAFSAILRRAFREYKVRRMIGSNYYTFVLPFALDIPIFSGMGDEHDSACRLPVPFPDSFKTLHRRRGSNDQAATLAWEDWQQSYLAKLCRPDYMEDGKWVGCYAEIAAPPSTAVPQVDAPMTNVAFKVDGEGRLRATGRDSLGRFTLAGRLSFAAESLGAIKVRKTYAAEGMPEWDWHARMTPFGIGGVWGPAVGPGDAPKVRGAFWLWKHEWTTTS